MKAEDIKNDLTAAIPGIQVTVEGEALIVAPENLLAAAGFLKENEKYRLDYLSCLTGVDYLAKGHLESVNHLYSVEKKTGPVVVKVRVPRNNPKMPSLVPFYRGAEFQERESFDLFGIVYEGHPDLRRILLWDEFEGHPMRKDYVQEDQDQP
ncbi:MAG: NADH-quinone oxidoreductase subunit C [Candidatus Omnitrophica bacterium]|nr:NADH-quinone oxidoreductase subunit C [Candidatus Omnitrophota bacterium]